MAPSYAPYLCRWYSAMKAGCAECVLSVGGLDYNIGVPAAYTYIQDLYAGETRGGPGPRLDARATQLVLETVLMPSLSIRTTTVPRCTLPLATGSINGVCAGSPGQEIHYQALSDTYSVLVKNGQGNKMLWVNEYGWNNHDEVCCARRSQGLCGLMLLCGGVDDESQSYNGCAGGIQEHIPLRTGVRFWGRMRRRPPHEHVVAQMATYLCLTDLPSTPDSGHDYGLCSQDTATETISPRPSYVAFQQFPKT